MWSMLPWWPKSWNPFSRWHTTSAFDYDTILARLTEEIESVEATLLDIKVRRSRATRSVMRTMLSIWVGFLGVFWGYAWVMHSSERAWYRTVLLLGLVLGTPLFLAVLYRAISLWFGRMEGAQESHLNALRSQRQDKINEIKKATDYEHLRVLLDRYDEKRQEGQAKPAQGTDAPQTLHKRLSFPALRSKSSKEQLQRSRTLQSQRTIATEPNKQTGLAPAITGLPIMGVPSTPVQRGWLDKIADTILGTDPYGVSAEEQQYALICRHCFRHNGLVPKNELEEVRAYLRV
ncbi:hypothetical protein MVES1_003755 [Malassezia vespertilionis]|uniref:uncharacterized protein n=1 Tax=Malassezia vespertilionis TaxID=2020962 RepID=UPI0024B146D1|nr:uncharacterized protein MVES1_003755 [Malassezia vespertilionis]WFD08383.1 hypothetical protein MVES1_003755 [Malassezia vespertilionis]